VATVRRYALPYLAFVVVCAVLAGLAAYVVARRHVSYTARSTFAVSSVSSTEQLLQSGSSPSPAATANYVQSQSAVITGVAVLSRARRILAKEGLGPFGRVQANANADAGTIAVVTNAKTAAAAAATANAVVLAYRQAVVENRRTRLRSAANSLAGQMAVLQRTTARLRRQERRASPGVRSEITTQRLAAQDRYQEVYTQQQNLLTRLGVVDSGAEVLATAQPGNALPSRTGRLGALGLLLGGALAALAALLRERGAGIVRRPADIEDETSLTVLADLPRVSRRRRRHLAPQQRSGNFFEALRRVRVHLQLLGSAGDPTQVVLLTSADPGEGKTFVAANLAATWAASGQRVLLMSTDVRKPDVERLLTKRSMGAGGLSSVLRGPRPSHLADATIRDVQRNLDLLPAGSAAGSLGDDLQTPEFEALLNQARGAYDAIIMDSPPLLSASDGLILAGMADVTLVVAALGATRRARLRLAREILNSALPPRVYAIANRDVGAGVARGDANQARPDQAEAGTSLR
jgi:Mrp family chromosome partitioning ATPase